MTLEYILKYIPHNRILAVYDLLRALDSLDYTALNELAYNERLVELCCHVFGYATLMKVQLRPDNNDRMGLIVNPLTEKVLTETSLFALEAVGQRFQRPVGVSLDCIRLA